MTTRGAIVGSVLVAGLLAGPAAGQGVPLGSPIPQRPLGEALEEERPAEPFMANQLTFDRVAEAKAATDVALRDAFDAKGVIYPAREIFLRVFKHERILQLWARARPDQEFTLIKEYPVCALPGQLGPKRKLGDVQVPEGFYFIDEFNPRSAFHLSLRVSYPNLADRMRREALDLGGDIYIHGGCETIGCVPIENENIEEVYWLAVQAMEAGQRVIPVHIFPARLDPDRLRWLAQNFNPEPELLAFWHNLADGYAFFEETRRVPWVTVGEDGRYHVPPRAGTAGDTATAGPLAPDSGPGAAGPPGSDASAGGDP